MEVPLTFHWLFLLEIEMNTTTYYQKDIEENYFKNPNRKAQARIYLWFKRNNKLDEFYEMKEKARTSYNNTLMTKEHDIEKTFKSFNCKYPNDWQYKRRIIRVKSKQYAIRILKLQTEGLEIHHCYGMKVASFVVLSPENHKLLHREFGRENEDCLISNVEVAKLISEMPHILVKNGEITENTMKSSEVEQ